MTTEKQIEANRNNAKLSTGPTTDRGKSLARLNALKSGVHSRSRILPGEDAKHYQALESQTFDTCNPVGPIESAVTRRIIECMWRLDRLAQAERAALLRSEIEEVLRTRAGPGRFFLADRRDIETTLKSCLGIEWVAQRRAILEAAGACEPVWENSDTPLAEERMPDPPVAFTFLESYGYAKANPLCAEIDRQMASTMKELLRLQSALDAMQERRQTLTVPVIEAL